MEIPQTLCTYKIMSQGDKHRVSMWKNFGMSVGMWKIFGMFKHFKIGRLETIFYHGLENM